MHVLVALISGGVGTRCFLVGKRPGLGAWRWFGFASGFIAVSHLAGVLHNGQAIGNQQLVSVVELLTFCGLIAFVVGSIRMLAVPAGSARSIETRIDGWLAGLDAASLASEFLLLPATTRVDFSSSQQAAFFAIQLVFVLLITILAFGIVWQPAAAAKLSFGCLLTGAALQVGTFHWKAADLEREFDRGNDKILVAIGVYGLLALATWFAAEGSARRAGRWHHPVRWANRGIGVPALCVIIQLGIVARIAFGRPVDWSAICLLFVSFLVIAYRLNVTNSLGQRLTERTRERDRMMALATMSRALSEAGNLESVITQLAHASALIVNGGHARVACVDPDAAGVRWFKGYGETVGLPDAVYAGAVMDCIGVRSEPFSLPGSDALTATAPFDRSKTDHGGLTLIAPLWDDALFGFVEIWSDDDDWSFAQEDAAVVTAMSREASLAIRHVNALESARRSAHDRALILRVSQAASSVFGLRTVAGEIAENSLGVAGAESCAIEHWLPESQEFEVIADRSVSDWPGDEATGSRFRGDSNLIYAYAFRNTEPLLTRRGDLESDDPKLSALMDQWEIGSAVTFPLWADGQLIGLLEFFSRRVDAFDTAALRLGEQIAAQAGLAIRHSHLLTVAKRNADERAILLRVSQAATSSSSMREMLDQIATVALDVPRVESCSVRLWRKETQVLERVAGVAVPDWRILDIVEPALDLSAVPGAYSSITQREPVLLDPDDGVDASRRANFARFGIGSLLFVPLWLGDVCAGELIFASRDVAAFDDDVQRLGQEIGQLTAVAIQRARPRRGASTR